MPESFPQKAPRQKLGEFLISHALVDQRAVDAALAEQKITRERLGLILSRNGFVTRRDLLQAILEIDPQKMHAEQIYSSRVPPQLLIDEKTMMVAQTDQEVYFSTLSSQRKMEVLLQPYFPEMRICFVPANHESIDSYIQTLMSLAQSENNLIEVLLRRALADNVSDIHIVPRYASFTVFFRYLGVRTHAHEGTVDEYNTLAARIKDLAKMDLAERRVPQDGGFQFDYDGKIVDLRVATVPTTNGETIVIRLLDPDRVQPNLNGLGITRVADWRKGVSLPDGLCLICGPTGSGKTTTLNASIKEMDRFGRAIFSVEDPVEYRIGYTGQVNTNHPLGLDFARAVRAFMRSDPDVIIVGEIRDYETAKNALKAAETGHLVLGTLHTGSILGAAQRLKDLDIPSHELRYLLRSVLVQRLVRTLCPHCRGSGCPHCRQTGFSGRTVVSECAYFNSEKAVDHMLAGQRWWPSMLEDAMGKAQEGLTTEAEVVRVFGAEAQAMLDARKAGESEAASDESQAG